MKSDLQFFGSTSRGHEGERLRDRVRVRDRDLLRPDRDRLRD